MDYQKDFMEAMSRRRGAALNHPEMLSQFQVGENEPVPHPVGEMAGSVDALSHDDVSSEPPIPRPGSKEAEGLRMERPMETENEHDGNESPRGSKFMHEAMVRQPMAKDSLKARAMLSNWEKMKK